jgi:hypothetical protein
MTDERAENLKGSTVGPVVVIFVAVAGHDPVHERVDAVGTEQEPAW